MTALDVTCKCTQCPTILAAGTRGVLYRRCKECEEIHCLLCAKGLDAEQSTSLDNGLGASSSQAMVEPWECLFCQGWDMRLEEVIAHLLMRSGFKDMDEAKEVLLFERDQGEKADVLDAAEAALNPEERQAILNEYFTRMRASLEGGDSVK